MVCKAERNIKKKAAVSQRLPKIRTKSFAKDGKHL
nr:MAG TPA: hypothetical protein [Bacteriophage sp.]